jgi:hypothetical protein
MNELVFKTISMHFRLGREEKRRDTILGGGRRTRKHISSFEGSQPVPARPGRGSASPSLSPSLSRLQYIVFGMRVYMTNKLAIVKPTVVPVI